MQTATEILQHITSIFKILSLIPICQISYDRQDGPLKAMVYIKKDLKG